jgi:hypothetical protein
MAWYDPRSWRKGKKEEGRKPEFLRQQEFHIGGLKVVVQEKIEAFQQSSYHLKVTEGEKEARATLAWFILSELNTHTFRMSTKGDGHRVLFPESIEPRKPGLTFEALADLCTHLSQSLPDAAALEKVIKAQKQDREAKQMLQVLQLALKAVGPYVNIVESLHRKRGLPWNEGDATLLTKKLLAADKESKAFLAHPKRGFLTKDSVNLTFAANFYYQAVNDFHKEKNIVMDEAATKKLIDDIRQTVAKLHERNKGK